MSSWREHVGDLLADDPHLRRLKELESHKRGERMQQEEQDRISKEDKPIISISNWIENDYFAGSFARAMYPKLKQHVINIVDGNYHKIYLLGATRYGKSYAVRALQGRSLYENFQKAVPQRSYHIDDASQILYLSMNVTGKKALDAYFSSFSKWVRSTEYFKQEATPNPRMIHQLQFPKGIICNYSGAQKSAAESEDLHFFVGDECNLYDDIEKSLRSHTGERYNAAVEIATEVDNRMAGTYQNKFDGSYPSSCKEIWLCKETYPKSFMRTSVAEVIRSGAVARNEVYVIESTEWGTKPIRCKRCDEIVDEKAYECGNCQERIKPIEYFWIRTASRTESAQLIFDKATAKEAEIKATTLKDSNAPEDELFQVMPVPMLYKGKAESNIEKFQRDMCGIPTEAISIFFRQREILFKAIRKAGDIFPGKADRPDSPRVSPNVCRHPFTQLTTNFEDGVSLIKDALAVRRATGYKDEKGNDVYTWRPIVNPGTPRYIGIDAGLSGDSCGFAMGHRCGWKKVLRYDQDPEHPNEVMSPITWVDLALRITPPPGGEIPYRGMLALTFALMRLGFGIAKMTCDSYQHVAITQPMSDKGIDVEVVSVDRTPDAYNYLHSAYSEGRLSTYQYEPLEGELVALERIVTKNTIHGQPKEKVDHPPSGEKDIADAEAQMVQQVEMASVEMAGYEVRPSAIEPKHRKPIIEDHTQQHTIARAFQDGDFESMEEMMRKQEDEW